MQATRLRTLIGSICLLLLAACSEQPLYSGLSEQEANEMVTVLASGGLESRKEAGKDDLYNVTAGSGDFAAAVRMLTDNGLPRQRYDSLGEVFAKEGFVSSPLEERARLNHALSQEIASTLSSIDGVLMARVHLAVPQRNELSDTRSPSSASVFVKHRKGVKLDDKVSKIKALVVNGIENLPYDNVTVALFEAGSASQRLGELPADSVLPTQSASAGLTLKGSAPVNARLSSLVPAELPMGRTSAIAGIFLVLLAVVYFVIRFWRTRQTSTRAMSSQGDITAGRDPRR